MDSDYYVNNCHCSSLCYDEFWEMIVDKITVEGKRVVIQSDTTKVAIHMDTYLSFSFDVGDDIDFEHLMFDSNKREALSKAISYCSRRMLTAKQLRDKLSKLSFDQKVIEYCIEKLEEYHYLDDYHYALSYYESKIKTHGTMYIYSKLREKGISSDIIGMIDIQEDVEDMLAILYKKYGESREVTYKEKSKMVRFLCNRGFLTPNAIQAVDLYIDKK